MLKHKNDFLSTYFSIISIIIILNLISFSNNKYKARATSKIPKASESGGSILVHMKAPQTSLHSNNKNYYTVSIKVGSPSQQFNLQVDTSTATSWIPSVDCDNCYSSSSIYDHKKSKTSSITWDIVKLEDENGDVIGHRVTDQIEFSGFKLNNYGFVSVEHFNNDFGDHYDGKLALGINNPYSKEYSILDILKAEKIIDKKIFSINILNNSYAMLLIGDLPVQNYSFCNITRNDDLDKEYSQSMVCLLTHISLNDKNNMNENNTSLKDMKDLRMSRVNFDSAYPYISVPKTHIDFFIENVFRSLPSCESFKTFNQEENEIIYLCDKIEINKDKVLSFILDGYSYNIQLKNLFIDANNPSKMEFLIRFVEDSKAIWSFGYPFMREFLIIYNMEKEHVGIHSNDKTKISDFRKEWYKWYGYEAEQFIKKENKIKTSIIILGFIILIIIALLGCRCLCRKYNDENGPMIGPTMNDIQKIDGKYALDRLY